MLLFYLEILLFSRWYKIGHVFFFFKEKKHMTLFILLKKLFYFDFSVGKKSFILLLFYFNFVWYLRERNAPFD